MALYQGEDIMISITGEGATNLNNNNFVILLIPKIGKEPIELQGAKFFYSEDEDVYTYRISNSITRDMLGLYDIEIKLQNKEISDYVSIFKKEDAIFIERSRIKDIEIISE